jgi:hypothetical protein
MPNPEDRESACESASGRKQIETAKWWGRICGTLGVLLMLAIVADIVYGETGGGLAAGIVMFRLFQAWVPVGLFSLIGAVLSLIAWRKHLSQEARTAFWLCLGPPIAAALLWLSIMLFDCF